MFWNIFYELCTSHGKKPNPVAKELGISSATVTKWKNGAMPSLGTAQKIADHFGVSVDHLLGKTDNVLDSDRKTLGLSNEELELLFAYRQHPEMRSAVRRLLCLDEQDGIYLYTAAHSEDKRLDTVAFIDREKWERLKCAPETDETLM